MTHICLADKNINFFSMETQFRSFAVKRNKVIKTHNLVTEDADLNRK